MKTRPIFQVLFVSLFCLCCHPSSHADPFSGKCVGVKDGDTIEVMHNGRAETVRLNGIDCPESRQAFGARAKQATSSLAFGQQVSVLVRDTDRYGRTVADVALPDGTVLNQRLVAAGMAWWYEKYAPRDATLKTLQERARMARAGLWADPSPIPPWEFRNGRTGARGSPQADSQRASAGPRVAPSVPVNQGQAGTATGAGADANAGIVYVTKGGKKYHRAECRYVSSGAGAMRLRDAQGRGYQPCKVCSPR